jgi:hypothetical protein
LLRANSYFLRQLRCDIGHVVGLAALLKAVWLGGK